MGNCQARIQIHAFGRFKPDSTHNILIAAEKNLLTIVVGRYALEVQELPKTIAPYLQSVIYKALELLYIPPLRNVYTL